MTKQLKLSASFTTPDGEEVLSVEAQNYTGLVEAIAEFIDSPSSDEIFPRFVKILEENGVDAKIGNLVTLLSAFVPAVMNLSERVKEKHNKDSVPVFTMKSDVEIDYVEANLLKQRLADKPELFGKLMTLYKYNKT